MPEQTIIAMDVGSSALKAVLFSAAGDPLAQHVCPYPTQTAADGAAEQDPDDWWRACIEAVRALEPGEGLQALVLTGSMQNLIAVDREGRALMPAML